MPKSKPSAPSIVSEVRKGIRVRTHRLNHSLAPPVSIQFGSDLVDRYDTDTLEQALIVLTGEN